MGDCYRPAHYPEIGEPCDRPGFVAVGFGICCKGTIVPTGWKGVTIGGGTPGSGGVFVGNNPVPTHPLSGGGNQGLINDGGSSSQPQDPSVTVGGSLGSAGSETGGGGGGGTVNPVLVDTSGGSSTTFLIVAAIIGLIAAGVTLWHHFHKGKG